MSYFGLENILNPVSGNINTILSDDRIRVFIFVSTCILIGYTLQPVPKWLNSMFDNSNIFKYFVILVTGIVSFYPVNNNTLFLIIIYSWVLLWLMNLARDYDKKKEEKKNV